MLRSDRRMFLAGSLALGAAGAVGLPAGAVAGAVPPTRTPLSRLSGAQVPTPLCFAPSGLAPVAGGGGRVEIAGLGRLAPEALAQQARRHGNYVFEVAGNGRPDAGAGCDATHGQMHAADWTGTALADLLGPVPSDAVVVIEGEDGAVRLPAAKAMADAFLATAMNGAAIGPWHGGPVRLVVPGWDGATWMRGVRRVSLAPADAAGDAGPRARPTDDIHPSRAAYAPHVLGVKGSQSQASMKHCMQVMKCFPLVWQYINFVCFRERALQARFLS